MIQVVDYQNGLYGISQTVTWGGRDLYLKINNVEFTLPTKKELTITEIPTEVFQKEVKSPQLINYVDANGNLLRVDEYQAIVGELNKLKVWDDDAEESIWETREDKERYDKFVNSWKPVYSESIVEWTPVKFELVIKEPIPDKYKEFITSSIIVETRYKNGNYDNNNEYKKAICTYISNPTKMVEMVAKELGFTIVDNENKTEGLKIFIYKTNGDSVLRFSKVNGNYFKIPENIWKQYRNIQDSLEKCIAKYEWEYKQIYDFLLGVSNTVNNKVINPEERKELVELLDNSIGFYNKIDSMKSTRDYYRYLGNSLKELKNKLLMLS